MDATEKVDMNGPFMRVATHLRFYRRQHLSGSRGRVHGDRRRSPKQGWKKSTKHA